MQTNAGRRVNVPSRAAIESQLAPGRAGIVNGSVVMRGDPDNPNPFGLHQRPLAGSWGAEVGGGLPTLPELGGGGGGGAGGGAGGGGGGGGGGAMQFNQNVAQLDPFLQRHAGRIESELTNWEDLTDAEIDRAASKRRALTEGQRRGMEGLMSQKGQLGSSGAPGQTTADLLGKEASDVAGMTTDISLAEKKRKRDFMLGATGALGAPGQAAREDRASAREDFRTNLSAAQAAQQMELERQRMQMEMTLGPLRLLMGSL
jgi:hypothetical protein